MSDELPMAPALRRTVCNPRWLLANRERLQQCFPEQWTPLGELNALAVGERLRALGVRWHGERELNGVLLVLQSVGVMRLALGRTALTDRDVDVVRRGPLVVRAG